MKTTIFFLIFCLATSLYSVEHVTSPEEDVKKLCMTIENCLAIQDNTQALEIAKNALRAYPDSILLYQMAIKTFAVNKLDSQALSLWEEYAVKFTSIQYEPAVLESLGWAVLQHAMDSLQVIPMSYALIGATMTRDTQGVSLVLSAMDSSHFFIRGCAYNLASHMPDNCIKERLYSCIQKEKNPLMRMAAIEACGRLKISKAKELLIEQLNNNKLSYVEKRALAEAIVVCEDTVSYQHILSLSKDSRSELRLLACEGIKKLPFDERLEIILPLLDDPQLSIQLQALYSLGNFLSQNHLSQELQGKLMSFSEGESPYTSILSSWILCRIGQSSAINRLQYWLSSSTAEIRRYAAGAMATVGEIGSLAMQENLIHSDPYVRLNLAVGLIKQRKNIDIAAKELTHFLEHHSERIMIEDGELNFFYTIAPSNKSVHPFISHYPDVVNQMARIDLLSLLCCIDDDSAFMALQKELENREWNLCGMAAVTLLKQGSHEIIEQIFRVLHSDNKSLRLQAALAIAFLGRDSRAIDALQGLYPYANKQDKIKILEALAYIGNKESLPFLMQAMKEPVLSLRVVAASALLCCLNN